MKMGFGQSWCAFYLIWGLVCSWVPSSVIFHRKHMSPRWKKLVKTQVRLFGEEVKEPFSFSNKSATPEEDGANLLNQSVEFDTRLLPIIDSEKVVQEQKLNRKSIGEMHGIDDPRDAYWRLKTENIIRNCINGEKKVAVYDISWNIADLNVVIEPREGGAPIDVEMITQTSRTLEDALMHFEDELRIFSRHELIVTTKGVPNHLKCERDYIAFKGFDVAVAIKSLKSQGIADREPVFGKLLEVGIHDTFVTQKGRKVTIPNSVVENITLIPAKYEKGDRDRNWFKHRRS